MDDESARHALVGAGAHLLWVCVLLLDFGSDSVLHQRMFFLLFCLISSNVYNYPGSRGPSHISQSSPTRPTTASVTPTTSLVSFAQTIPSTKLRMRRIHRCTSLRRMRSRILLRLR